MGNYLESYTRKTKIITLGGKDFTFSELSLCDLAEFRARVVEKRNATREIRKQQIIKDATDLGVDPITILDRIDKPPTDEEIEAEMETIEGIGFLAYKSLKYKYPEITEKEVMQMITLENVGDVAGALVSGEAEKPKKKRTRQPIKKK